MADKKNKIFSQAQQNIHDYGTLSSQPFWLEQFKKHCGGSKKDYVASITRYDYVLDVYVYTNIDSYQSICIISGSDEKTYRSTRVYEYQGPLEVYEAAISLVYEKHDAIIHATKYILDYFGSMNWTKRKR
jgi:hypothetical protein